MRPIERLLARLPDAKRNGKGWKARCPAHDDLNPSLSIHEGADGRVLMYCHAGCDTSAIVAALGLTLADLRPVNSTQLSPVVGLAPMNKFSTPEDALMVLQRQYGPLANVWKYMDRYGQLVGMVLRWNTPQGKRIRPVSRQVDGTWAITAMPSLRPLYRLPELLNRPTETVYVCEGEKAADAAVKCGLLSTTSAGGANAASKTDWSPLAGRQVVIIPDHDDAGRKYAAEVARLCLAAGVLEVRILDWSNIFPDRQLPTGYDIADAEAESIDDDDRMGLQMIIEHAAEKAEPVVKLPPVEAVKPGPILTCLADVESRPVAWLWPGRIPLGRITLLVGRPGEGKSFLTMDWAARVTRGRPWPDGRECPQGSVLLISAEDDPADTIRPRLEAHGADLQRIYLLSSIRQPSGLERFITLADIDSIEEAVIKLNDCKLMVIDPIGSYLGSKIDAYRDNEVRELLIPLAMLGEKHGVAILMIAHHRKSPGNVADDLILGSRAFTGVARAVWHVARDNENRDRRLLLPGKNNLAATGDGLAFSIMGNPPCIAWESNSVAMNADDALTGNHGGTVAIAKSWLRSELANGCQRAKDLLDKWKNTCGGSERTLARAKRELGVQAYRPENSYSWWWRLPGRPA